MRTDHWVLEVAVLAMAAVWLAVSKPTTLERSGLLPPSILPELYEISLDPSLEQGVFHGLVVITGVALAQTDRIVLHCRSLVFNTTTLTDITTEERVEIEDIEEDQLLQQCHLLLNQSLELEHEYSLSVEFMGVIGKDGIGLYRDSYVEEGIKREILMTHFQPNLARTVFPCFDEPHYKAQFLLRVTRQGFPTVLSNMPASRDSRDGWVQFEETPLMSPYLLVLVMCDYLALSDSATNTSVWAPRSRLHEAQLALNISVAVLEYCERYFGMEYVLPKLDHVAVPTLHTAAMENWGTITYKNSFLLWEEGVSTWAQKEMIASVICHEIIHQWLGNLVTTTWWNTTWLNEGVTSFYHYYIIDKIEPSWNVMDNMFISQIHMILDTEAMGDHKPLTSNQPLPQDSIASTFSASTYLKGAAIMRMVFNLMSPDVFREAISQYIIDNEYGSVDEEDLWQSLAAVADLPIDLEEVMQGWTHQQGYPLVTVDRANNGCLTVYQGYFGDQHTRARWTIPLTFTTSSDLDFNISTTLWFPEDSLQLDLDVCLEPTDWVILNIRQSGFYRVNYDPLTWRALTHDLHNCDLSDIHPVNRAHLLHDGFFLARHHLLEYPVILDLSRYLHRETEYLPWSVAIAWLNKIRSALFHTDLHHHFQRYAMSLLEEPFSKMSLSGEAGGMIEELHRKQLVEFACGMGHLHCVKEATDNAYLLMSGVQVQIPLELYSTMLCTAVRHGQAEVWHFVLKEYLESRENAHWRYLGPLACTADPHLLNRLLKAVSKSGSFVKSSEERLQLLMEIGKQPGSFDTILGVIIENFGTLSADFDFEVIIQLLSSILPSSLTSREIEKFNNLTAMVVKNSPTTKQVDLLYSLVEDVNKPLRTKLGPLLDESAKQWFMQYDDADDDDDDDVDDDDDDDDYEHHTFTPPNSTPTNLPIDIEESTDKNEKTTSEQSAEDEAPTQANSGRSSAKDKATHLIVPIVMFLLNIKKAITSL